MNTKGLKRSNPPLEKQCPERSILISKTPYRTIFSDDQRFETSKSQDAAIDFAL
jgi:hypothetical protein